MKIKSLFLIILFLIGTLMISAKLVSLSGKGTFNIEGDRRINYDSASVYINFMKSISIWKLTLSTPYEYKKKEGSGFMVNLFFSRKFSPKAGTFPIKFNYLNQKDTLGGSLVVSGEKRGMFSHDTEGKVTFKTFGEKVSGEFEMITFKKNKEGKDEKVTIKGSFNCPRGDALK